MSLFSTVLRHALSWRYGSLTMIILLVITLNSFFLLLSQILQQSSSKTYHHGEVNSIMGIHINERDSEEKSTSKSFQSAISSFMDNIAGIDERKILCSPEIDIVYTWVNGSDPRQVQGLSNKNLNFWLKKIF